MDNDKQLKKGFYTSEFWTVIVGALVALFALLKIPIDQTTIEGAVTAIGTLISFVALIISYIRSRTDLKKTQMTSEATKEVAGSAKTDATISIKQ